MRILIFCNKLPYPRSDGSAIAMHNMIRGYWEAGASVTVLALNTWKHYHPPEAIPETDVLRQIKLITVPVNTAVTVSGAVQNLFSGKAYHASRFYRKEVANQLIALLQEQSFDIVQLETVYLSNYLPVIRHHTKASIVLRAHNVEHQLWQQVAGQARNPLKRAYLRLQSQRLKSYEHQALEGYDAILPITDNDQSALRRLGFQGPMKRIPVGLPLAEYDPGNADTPGKQVFHLGAMDWQPNQQAVHWLLKAVWPLVLKAVPEAQLALAGRNMPADLQSHDAQHVTIYGEVPDAQAFMRSGDVMVVPLSSGSGLRIKILEGMALQKAIVSTSTGAAGISATSGRHLLIANDATAFANHIIECLQRAEYQQSLGEAARAMVADQYDLAAVARQALNFLHHVHHQPMSEASSRSA